MNKQGFLLVDGLLIIIISLLVIMLASVALPLCQKENKLRHYYYAQIPLPPC